MLEIKSQWIQPYIKNEDYHSENNSTRFVPVRITHSVDLRYPLWSQVANRLILL